MKILVTGSEGFIGKNLCLYLKQNGEEPLGFDRDNAEADLVAFVAECDAIIHLAGVNRPKDNEEFVAGNVGSLETLIKEVKKTGRKIPILLSSSTQAIFDNPYGKSKKEAEDLLFDFARVTGNPVYVYRLANAFGKWCRPYYNSVVATFCYEICKDQPDIKVNENAPEIEFVYIDDIVRCFYQSIKQGVSPAPGTYLSVTPSYLSTPRKIADLLTKFRKGRDDLQIALQDGFEKKLYATYLSYLREDDFWYDLVPHGDNRGSFTEIFKMPGYGQVSLNVINPGITKGNHYHNSKNEKFVVLSGRCLIAFRKVNTEEVLKYDVQGNIPKVVDIPPGYVHSITNLGEEKAYVLMWANEPFDMENPDTFPEEV